MDVVKAFRHKDKLVCIRVDEDPPVGMLGGRRDTRDR